MAYEGLAWGSPQDAEVSSEKAAMILRMLSAGLMPEKAAHFAMVSEEVVRRVAEQAEQAQARRAAEQARLQELAKMSAPEAKMEVAKAEPAGAEEEEEEEAFVYEDCDSGRDKESEGELMDGTGGTGNAPAAEALPRPPLMEDVQMAESGPGLAEVLLTPEVPAEDPVSGSLRRVQAHVFRRRHRSVAFFTDFDVLRCGRCTREQFKRAVANMIYPSRLDSLEGPVDAVALAEAFVEPDSKRHEPQVVNYAKFCSVVDEVFNLQQLERTPRRYVPSPGATVTSSGGLTPRMTSNEIRLAEVLQRVATLTESRGINISGCFDDVKRNETDIRCGRLSPEEFLKNFPLAKPTPTHGPALEIAELDLLLQRYTDDQGQFRLFLLERDIEDILGKRPRAERLHILTHMPMREREQPAFMESSGFPLQRPASQRPKSAGASFGRRLAQSPETAQEPELQGSRPLTAASLRPQTPAQARPMTAGSARPGTGGSVRPVSAYLASARRTPMSTTSTTRPRPDLMTRIEKVVHDRRLRVRDAFRDVDRYNRGTCTDVQAKVALSLLQIQLETEEYDELMVRYGTDEGFFNWQRFSADLEDNESSTTAGASGNGVAAVRALACRNIWAPELTPEEEAEVAHLQAVLAKRVRDRGMALLQVFDDFAAHRWACAGHVTRSQFARALVMLGLRITEKEQELLCRAYCDTEPGNEVNYADFCAALDPTCARGSTTRANKARLTAATTLGFNASATPTPTTRVTGIRNVYVPPTEPRYFDRRGRVRPTTARPSAGVRRGVAARPQSARVTGTRPYSAVSPTAPASRYLTMCG